MSDATRLKLFLFLFFFFPSAWIMIKTGYSSKHQLAAYPPLNLTWPSFTSYIIFNHLPTLMDIHMPVLGHAVVTEHYNGLYPWSAYSWPWHQRPCRNLTPPPHTTSLELHHFILKLWMEPLLHFAESRGLIEFGWSSHPSIAWPHLRPSNDASEERLGGGVHSISLKA